MRGAVLLLAWAGACATDLARRPVARVRLDPPAVAEGDGYATAVTLDGTASRDDFEDPGAPLGYAWAADDPAARFEGSTHEGRVRVRVSGQTPVAFRLTVRTPDGRAASVEARLGLTLRE